MTNQYKISKYQLQRIRKQAQEDAEICDLYNALYPKKDAQEPSNQSLHKPYLRLTQQIDFEKIRPLNILQEALKLFKKQYKSGEIDYQYFNDQLRSIRQDINVQNIENEFTIKTYEANALASIDSLDLYTFEQCQMKLLELYLMPIKAKRKSEFLCYIILYHALKDNKDQLINIFNTQSIDTENDLIYFALNMCSYLSTKNYYKVFRCFYYASNKMSKMIQPFLPQLRKRFIKEQKKGLIGEGSTQYLADIAWDGDLEACMQFISKEL
ncbi:unnamed protein product (macronuclear) [Paramecium tetraurelia]|uniref:SAC3/GANP/THP3 conserved domain-containing protein n=1 Tax=Paramecium tetraurelia TaxID=5888 RepID=A0DAN8_PARTE|nr:uncharacterized protein GSPATT00015012001 [Paramecium tetraurelia]CAK80105.1 unnamed protein product [Paramecium tetraurelia]|eukprot:XP_001447502.1 hypothetical protein (macronuclear) [Paramecium tetraurelia strain d4-2]